MRKPSITYRFFCTLTALIVLLSAGTPSGAYAGILSGYCDISMSGHSMPHMSDAEDCALNAQHSETTHGDTQTNYNNDSCFQSFTCTCILDSAEATTNAIPALSKTFTGLVQVAIETLSASVTQKPVHSSEQIFASLYSPPIFLKNSSFLN